LVGLGGEGIDVGESRGERGEVSPLEEQVKVPLEAPLEAPLEEQVEAPLLDLAFLGYLGPTG
jgi:hypothetical protein